MKAGDECTPALIEGLGWKMMSYVLDDNARVFYQGLSRIIWIPKNREKATIEGGDVGTISRIVELKSLNALR